MARDNGGIIGPVNDPTEDIASGVWSNESQYEARRAGNWPNNAFIGQNSLRFNSGSSDYLTSSFTTPTNNKIWTLSFWFKRSEDATQVFLSCHDPVTDNRSLVYLDSGSVLRYQEIESGVANQMDLRTDALLRDFSAWYNIIVAVDTTQATASNRAKIYINGEQVTSFSTETYISQNTNTYTNTSGFDVTIGRNEFAASTYLGSYLSDYWFIDGKALEPTYFGAFDANGVWTPAASFTGDYGTNGFHLVFEDASSLGKDSGPGGNDFTVNNLTSIDQTTDTPTNNYCTWNGLNNNAVLSDGNITALTSGTNKWGAAGTLGVSSGKYYWEVKASAKEAGSGNIHMIGIESDPSERDRNDQFAGATTSGYSYYGTGQYYHNGSGTSYGDSYTVGDIVGVALDLDNNYVYFSKNGTWQNSGDPTSGASGTGGISITDPASQPTGFYFPSCGDGSSNYNSTVQANFGNPPFTISSGNSDANGYGNFEYAVPSGYYALNTKNLAEFG